jgi:hypothetical protein
MLTTIQLLTAITMPFAGKSKNVKKQGETEELGMLGDVANCAKAPL